MLNDSKVTDPTLSEDYDYNDDSGIVFCDLDLARDHSMDGLQIKNLRGRAIVGFPFCRINRIRCNQNQRSYLFYAIGYQTGFVRIKKLNREDE
jgi:general transcription factor 3C polypeptide 2